MMWLTAGLLFARAVVVEGLIVEVRPAESTVVISHKEIPGVMPAMAMPLKVRNAAELRALRRGMMVTVEMNGGEARRIRVNKARNAIEEDGKQVLLAPPKDAIAQGAQVPDLNFTDHAGVGRHIEEYRGAVVAIQFLYTRCPMAEVCPRLAATFARLQRRFADRKDLVLLSITLDPKHDTPPVLSRYAETWRAGERWRFLTGSEAQIKAAANCFGLVYWPEEGVITHTSSIALIGRSGHLEALVEGLSFTAAQLEDLIANEMQRGASR